MITWAFIAIQGLKFRVKVMNPTKSTFFLSFFAILHYMSSIFKVEDNFIGRSVSLNSKRGMIGEIRGTGRSIQVLCRFEEGYDEWHFPRDLWKDNISSIRRPEEGSGDELSPDTSSGEGSDDSEEPSDSESLSDN